MNARNIDAASEDVAAPARAARSSLAERVNASRDAWKERQDRMLQQVRGYVRERPVMALGVAVAVGFVLSRLARR